MRLLGCAVLGLLSTRAAFPQQVGVVDLTQLDTAHAVAQPKSDELPEGCTQVSRGIIADGVVTADGQPRRISLEIVKLSSDTFEFGGEGRAEIRLKNVGETPIQIPWSKDWGIMRKAPSPDHLEWEQGNFGIVLRDKQNHTIALKSAERWLFGSRFVTDSQMTIKPGEWVTALLSFKLQDMYHRDGAAEFPIGDGKLFAEWQQARREWTLKECAWNSGYFEYDGYYKQDRPTTAIHIKRSGAVDSAKAD